MFGFLHFGAHNEPSLNGYLQELSDIWHNHIYELLSDQPKLLKLTTDLNARFRNAKNPHLY